VALGQIEAWVEAPSLVLLSEAEGYWSELRPMLEAGQVAGAQVHAARVAALCSLHGVRELWTADRDFGRFPDLAVRNPLVG
jgi:predicted nucleic acid-binding protein